MKRLALAMLLIAMSIGWADTQQQRVLPLPAAAPVKDQNVQIVLRIRLDAARALRETSQPENTATLAELNAVLKRFDVALEPQHPNTANLELASYFTISNLSPPEAERLTAALRELDVVDAAYVQPAPTPPLRSPEKG